jgi:3-methylcrotonyl-CoA carboxylase beta subunit
VLFSESAVKGAHFVELCSQRKIPLVFLQNITGFMVGEIRGRRHRQGRRQAGDGGRDHLGAQDHHARRRLVRRGQLRHVRPRLFAALPVDLANSRISVMGGEQAAGVLATVKRDGIERKGGTWSAEEEAEFKRPDARAMFAAVAPALCLGAAVGRRHHRPAQDPRHLWACRPVGALNAPIGDTRFGVFRM